MPSSQGVTTSARDDDPGAPIKGEPRRAKSFASKRLAKLLQSAPGAQDPPSSTALRPLDAEQIKFLMKRGEQFIAVGDMVTARLAFQRAAEAGDANAAVALGATYDPTVLARFGVVGISADVAEARSWYRRAEKLGSPEARQRLEVLADR
jgi:TPR repeat protein